MKKVVYPELAAEMARRGDYQKTLAKLLGLTEASVTGRLSGKTQWTIEEIEKICKYYGKDYYELFKKK